MSFEETFERALLAASRQESDADEASRLSKRLEAAIELKFCRERQALRGGADPVPGHHWQELVESAMQLKTGRGQLRKLRKIAAEWNRLFPVHAVTI